MAEKKCKHCGLAVASDLAYPGLYLHTESGLMSCYAASGCSRFQDSGVLASPAPASPTPLEQSHRELLEALRKITEGRDALFDDLDNPPEGEDMRHFLIKQHEQWSAARTAIANAEKLEANRG